jgi:hypothetical protein
MPGIAMREKELINSLREQEQESLKAIQGIAKLLDSSTILHLTG